MSEKEETMRKGREGERGKGEKRKKGREARRKTE